MGMFDIDKEHYHFRLDMKMGNSIVHIGYFSTYGEAQGYAEHNGYHKYNKKKIETNPDYKNYSITDILKEK